MKFSLSVIFTALLSFSTGLWMPWWSISIVAFIVGLMVHQSPVKAFLSGFAGLFLLWGLMAWWIDMKNQGILSKKIALILPLSGNSFLLILVTALVGGIVAGMAAASGSFLRSAN